MSTFFNYTTILKNLQKGQGNCVLKAIGQDCVILAERFFVEKFYDVEFSYSCQDIQGTYLDLLVAVKAKIQLICSFSGKGFPYLIDESFILRFSSTPLEDKEAGGEYSLPIYWEGIDKVEDRINLGEIFIQYLALLIPDTPHSPDNKIRTSKEEGLTVYKKNPFEILDTLKR